MRHTGAQKAAFSLAGVVLAGGRSSRLGQDKTRLCLPHAPETLLLRTAALLETCTREVYISCREARPELPYPCIVDSVPDQGPAGGLSTVLRRVGCPVLVLSCDLPFMDSPTIQRLLRAWEQRPSETLMTAFQDSVSGRPEPLVAVYEAAALPYFEQALEAGQRRLSRIIPEGQQCLVPYTAQESRAFFNINTPQDMLQALQVLIS